MKMMTMNSMYVMTQFMYNLNFTKTRGHENEGYQIAINHQTYLQHRPQLHEMNHLQKSTKEL